MIIGIDCDNVVCNTTESVLAQHYFDTGEKLTLDDIKTYYIENYMGSDTTGIACLNTNRKYIGMELDDTYFEIAKERISKAVEKTLKVIYKNYKKLLDKTILLW